MIYIYCDESCHLERDNSDVMILGAITCPEHMKNKVYDEIRKIKTYHGFSSWFEIKWTKVTAKKIDFYKDILDYFFDVPEIGYRAIVATGKKGLNHNKYNDGDYDSWYYKMYYCLLNHLIEPTDTYRVFIDIKDTRGGAKVNRLHDIICNGKYDMKHEILRDIKQIRSHESELLEIVDLLNGAMGFYHRGFYDTSRIVNQGKVELIRYLIEDRRIDIDRTTGRYEHKFNILIWQPRG